MRGSKRNFDSYDSRTNVCGSNTINFIAAEFPWSTQAYVLVVTQRPISFQGGATRGPNGPNRTLSVITV